MSFAYPGLSIWLLQRTTAVVMALYLLLLISLLMIQLAIDHESWRSIFAPVWMKISTLLFFLSLFTHAWLGVKNVFNDYVKSRRIRLSLLTITFVSLLFYSFWVVRILWGLGA